MHSDREIRTLLKNLKDKNETWGGSNPPMQHTMSGVLEVLESLFQKITALECELNTHLDENLE